MSNRAWVPPRNSPQRDIATHFTHARLLKSAGYSTALVGKPEDYGPDRFNDYVINYARTHREKPFFIYYTSCSRISRTSRRPTPRIPAGAGRRD
ncbi:MAG: hypothetical protein Q7S40_13330 [Opitutaceae bacterium]|nr:hypothetical protein [Opitutaceae bacterium]